ncbi:MAG: histidine kinase, partial [Bacteroidota bacterium]|nr:histidine kinase [Bacteroidota bacterium]MDX5429938.1 histidine kinase [Bacteroidota bacterium]MDX5468711.1 histidine kinase [Bacteroidota bacterium]
LLGTNLSVHQVIGEDSLINCTYLFDSTSVVVENIYRDGPYVYISTKGLGLLIARIEKGRLVKDTLLTIKSGMPSNYVLSSIVDNQGQIWISTLRGVAKIVRLNSSNYYIKNYGRNQGIPDAFWEYGRFSKDPETGTLWIGNSEGILRIQPEKETGHVAKPIIHIEAIYLQDELKSGPESRTSLLLKPDSFYTIPYSLNSMEIHLVGILLSGAEELEYWYKLEGKNPDWQRAPENGILNLNNLGPGDYTLLVSAFNRSTKAFSDEMQIPFKVERPFWMSTWFYIGILVCFVLLVYGYFVWRMNEALKKQQAAMAVSRQLSESRYLAFQARMNPHFIFNSLNAIQYFITQNDKKSSLSYLSKFAKLLRQVLDHTKAIKIPLNEEIQMLKNYLEMESMRFDGHFDYSFDIEDQLKISQIEIPGMLLQPYVENAIIHGLLHLESGKGHLSIRMHKEGEYVICCIEDNGIGREKSAQINSLRKPNHKSHGLEIASNRLQMLVDDTPIEELIQVSDPEEGSGTIVRIKLPIL